MAYLEEIPEYKLDLLKLFVANDNIVKYIDSKDKTVEDAVDLIGKHVFPMHYIPDTETETKVYLCLDIFVPRVKDRMFKTAQIVINVFAHKDKTLVGYDSRVDMINIEIDKLLNGNMDFGIDEIELSSVSPYHPQTKFVGKQLVYNVMNFNQRRCKHNEHKV